MDPSITLSMAYGPDGQFTREFRLSEDGTLEARHPDNATELGDPRLPASEWRSVERPSSTTDAGQVLDSIESVLVAYNEVRSS